MKSLIQWQLKTTILIISLAALGGCGTSFESFIGGPAETYPSFPDSPGRNGTGWETSSD